MKFIDEKAVVFANVTLRHDYVEGTETSPLGYLEGIYVKENSRKKCYAKEIVEDCEKWAREKNAKNLPATVFKKYR
ncbi:MAG: GNAT family N-acetyltransferase [Peptoniphilus harei]|nr:GNAT family N-acetyltransferase [Peptoniphilus harei]